MIMTKLSKLITESRNELSQDIDSLSTIDMLSIINLEDQKVALAVKKELPAIAIAVDCIAHSFLHQGRLIYLGAGTSGRLGVLDASECPPTYGTKPEQVIALIAGGHKAILSAVENAEDNAQLAKDDLSKIALTEKDIVVGIAASGRTPYVIGGMEFAKNLGAKVISIASNPESPMAKLADISIEPIVGPEIVTGSSRMKAGTAQKLILNMLTTGAMIKTGKVFGNLMVDVEATNEKLRKRQVRIVMEATDASEQEAIEALTACQNHCKTAILMILTQLDANEAKEHLAKHQGFIRKALSELNKN